MKIILAGAAAPLLREIRLRILTICDFWRIAESGNGDLPVLVVESVEISNWSSATFIGHEHRIVVWLASPGTASVTFLDQLTGAAEPMIDLDRHIVVDLAIAAEGGLREGKPGVMLTISATTLDD